ncbi:MAG TPA: SPOR domain-containing protein [Rhodocyclaceae bacterium]|nr:SPOR domain-containing protein [Rhodocyclaceae bacterium]
MTEQGKAGQDKARDADADARRARRQLLVKGGIAAVAIAGLVTALVLMEGNREEEPAPTARTVTATGVTAPEAQSPSLAEATTRALRTSSEAAELQSVVMAEQQAVASAAGAAPVVPEESAEPLGVPPLRSSTAEPANPRQRETGGHLVLEQSPPRGGQHLASSSVAAVAKAPAPTPAPTPAKAPVAAASSAGAGNFFVQVGVFANPGNAEELHAKLKAAGIPTQIETRVQVGPFNTRQEAVAAQAKLKSLGLDGGMVVPARH